MTENTETATSPPSSRARRIVLFPVVRIVIGTIFVVGAMLAVQAMRAQLDRLIAGGEIASSLFATALSALAVTGAYLLFVRVVERRAVTELSLRELPRELGLGWLVGGGLFGAVIGLLAALGIYRVEGSGEWTVLIAGLLFSFGPALFEEMLFRGVWFRVVEEALGSWIALALSALVFGLPHLLNAGGTLQGALAIVLEAGLLLGAAFMLTRRLWLAIGIHAAWNYVQGGVFGISVSGTGANGFLVSRLQGPDLLTGGAFGAEGSIVAVAIGLAAALVFVLLARRRGHVVRPFWARRSAGSEPQQPPGPANNGLRSYDDQRVSPPRPQAPK
jgi:membrane protease YdiL (CAAX protease family)